MDPWKRRFLLETTISRFHVNFWEGNFQKKKPGKAAKIQEKDGSVDNSRLPRLTTSRSSGYERSGRSTRWSLGMGKIPPLIGNP